MGTLTHGNKWKGQGLHPKNHVKAQDVTVYTPFLGAVGGDLDCLLATSGLPFVARAVGRSVV